MTSSMSCRERRDPHGKRHYSRFDRESSDKRARRDEKPDSERPYSSSRNLENNDALHQHRRNRNKDEVPSATDNIANPAILKTGSDRKDHVIPGGSRHISEPPEASRSRSYQHDERSGADQDGRSHIGRSTGHGRRSDSRDQSIDRVKEESANLQRRNDRSQVPREDNKWKHDQYFKLESDALPARRRSAFTERKRSSDHLPIASAKESESRVQNHQVVLDDTRREQKVNDQSQGQTNMWNQSSMATRENEWRSRKFLERTEHAKADYRSRGRYEDRGPRSRERFNRRYNDGNQYQQVQPQKWKHDLFNEANRSPSPKNEEDQIAKVEALLAL